MRTRDGVLCMLFCALGVCGIQAQEVPWRSKDGNQFHRRPLPLVYGYMELTESPFFTIETEMHYAFDFCREQGPTYWVTPIENDTRICGCYEDDPSGNDNWIALSDGSQTYYIYHLYLGSVSYQMQNLHEYSDFQCEAELTTDYIMDHADHVGEPDLRYALHLEVYDGSCGVGLGQSRYEDGDKTRLPHEVWPDLRTFDPGPSPEVTSVIWPDGINPSYNVLLFQAQAYVDDADGLYVSSGGDPPPGGYRAESYSDGFCIGIYKAMLYETTHGDELLGEWTLNDAGDIWNDRLEYYGDYGGSTYYRLEYFVASYRPEYNLKLVVEDYFGQQGEIETDHPVADDEGVWNLSAVGDGTNVHLAWSSDYTGTHFNYAISTNGGFTYYGYYMGCPVVPGIVDYSSILAMPEYPIQYRFGYVFQVECLYPEECYYPAPVAVAREQLRGGA